MKSNTHAPKEQLFPKSSLLSSLSSSSSLSFRETRGEKDLAFARSLFLNFVTRLFFDRFLSRDTCDERDDRAEREQTARDGLFAHTHTHRERERERGW